MPMVASIWPDWFVSVGPRLEDTGKRTKGFAASAISSGS